MGIAPLLLVIAFLKFRLAALLLSADSRRTARLFATIVTCDGVLSLLRAVLLFAGLELLSPPLLTLNIYGGLLLSLLALEFVYAFPRELRPPWPLRLGLVLLALLCLYLWTRDGQARVLRYYFVVWIPWTLFQLFQSARALQRSSEGGGAWLLMLALCLRVTYSMLLFAVVQWRGSDLALFTKLTLIDKTVIPLFSDALLTFAVLRHELFRIRGLVARLLIFTGLAFATVSLTSFLVDLALRHVAGGLPLHGLLVGVSLLPAGVVALAYGLRPRVEAALSALDPELARRRAALERVLLLAPRSVDPALLLRLVLDALAEVLPGAKGRFLRTAEYPLGAGGGDGEAEPPALLAADLEEPLRAAPEGILLRRALPPELGAALPAALLLAVRSGPSLYGALAVDGLAPGQDREALRSAAALAEQLALRLDNLALLAARLRLLGELETSRHLAALGTFAAAIAHDIRTPLTSVQMNVQILRRKAEPLLPEDDREHFDLALGELTHLNATISQILEFAKPVELQLVPTDLAEVIEDAARSVAPLLGERQLQLQTEVRAGHATALADAPRLRQILQNLLTNAAQASGPGALITVETAEVEGRVAIHVRDCGRGIARENLAKIFEPFFTTRSEGTGLGLAIVRKLVRAHGGEVRVNSTPGQGTTVTVLLTAAPGSERSDTGTAASCDV